MPRSDRLGALVILVMLGLMLSGLVDLPVRELRLVFLGSDLALRFPGRAQLGIVLAALVCAGVDSIMRRHPLVQHRPLDYTITFWVLPSLLTLSGLIVLNSLAWWGYRIVFIGIVGILLTLIIVAEYRSVDPNDTAQWPARWGLNAAVYLAALIFFVSLYGSKLRSVMSATGVMTSSTLLALDLLRGAQGSSKRIWIYAVLVGVLMGELTWALNYCSTGARTGGALLLLVFYCLTGLLQQYLWGRLSRHVVMEFGTVGVIGMALLAGFSRWVGG